MNPPDPLSLAGFIAVVLFVVAAVLGMARSIKVTIGILAWLGLCAVAVGTGFIAAAPMPRVPVLMALSVVLGLAFALSPVGGRIARTQSLALLVGFQGFRLPLELVLHSWVGTRTIPATMSWDGANFDVITGILALVAIPLVGKHRRIAWIPNVVGFCLLLNVMRVAVFSMALPFGWQVEPPLLLPFFLPYALIVPVCVAGALMGHVVLTRSLLGTPAPH